jgi:hypothetical protein
VARWLKAIKEEIAEDRQHLAQQQRRGSSLSGFTERRLLEKMALRELLSRGLDPHQTRTFRGKILLTVRCAKRGRGHVLGRVYPTSFCPIFVPAVPELPYGSNSEKEQRFGGDHEQVKELRRVFGAGMSFRDTWIEEYPDDYDQRRVMFAIRGLTFLEDRQRAEILLGDFWKPALHLLCRCGTSIVPIAKVFDALGSGRAMMSA